MQERGTSGDILRLGVDRASRSKALTVRYLVGGERYILATDVDHQLPLTQVVWAGMLAEGPMDNKPQETRDWVSIGLLAGSVIGVIMLVVFDASVPRASGQAIPTPIQAKSDVPAPVGFRANVSTRWSESAPGMHTCRIPSSGSPQCWGYNDSGQLGDGSNTTRGLPVTVVTGGLGTVSGTTFPAVAGGFTSIVTGGTHTCGTTTTGAAYCWGNNADGQLGSETNASTVTSSFSTLVTQTRAPVLVSGGITFSSLTAGGRHTCGLTSAGKAYCWGANTTYQLGDGQARAPYSITNMSRTSPVAVSGNLTFASISAGMAHSCGLTTSNTAYCWGSNGAFQLGDNSAVQTVTGTFNDFGVDRYEPIAVVDAPSFSSVTAGDYHTCGLTPSGSAHCWGANWYGQLGTGVTGSTSINRKPVAVAGQHAFASLSAGATHTCGITTAGKVYCWGDNQRGQLGDGTRTQSNIPIASITPSLPVSGAYAPTFTFAGVISRGTHTCAQTSSGVMYCWGGNDRGQLGLGLCCQDLSTPSLVRGQTEPGTPGTVTLKPGWNLFALSGNPSKAVTAEDVCVSLTSAGGSGTASEIDKWEDGAWQGHICGLSPNNFLIELNRGYFVKVSRQVIWYLPS